mmetsp:Transcript_16812/g.36291  ORF Transcript_16812/g.36291 Transcript_16812/m.36291 type:complete len:210 (-) Transcript_16812:540-1169(-)
MNPRVPPSIRHNIHKLQTRPPTISLGIHHQIIQLLPILHGHEQCRNRNLLFLLLRNGIAIIIAIRTHSQEQIPSTACFQLGTILRGIPSGQQASFARTGLFERRIHHATVRCSAQIPIHRRSGEQHVIIRPVVRSRSEVQLGSFNFGTHAYMAGGLVRSAFVIALFDWPFGIGPIGSASIVSTVDCVGIFVDECVSRVECVADDDARGA